ncbi:MAG: MarR family transcriptional regulator [Zymomonas sp.]|nr:MAG: MarR family transcriptional regulator [Zymomonas sp.]
MTNSGALIRRCHQISVAIFLEETAGHDVSPSQYAALTIVAADPGIDQTTLMERSALDRSSVTSCVERLEGRGLLLREVDPQDRRVRRLRTTPEGQRLLEDVEGAVDRAQRRVVEPLGDRAGDFLAMLREVVEANNAASRVPVKRERGG